MLACVGCALPLSEKSYRRDVARAKVSKSAEIEGNIALPRELFFIYQIN